MTGNRNTFNTLRRTLLATAAALLAAACTPTWAQEGVSEKEIRIGMANALSGPASGLGT